MTLANAEQKRAGAHGTWLKLTALGCLFMAQTLPQAFVTQLLPAIYRKQGLELEKFWLFSIILIPNWVRWLWAPWIDSYGSTRFGRRKSWIVPCTILGSLSYGALLFVEPTLDHLMIAVAIMFVQTLVMATQEVAVDAYVVENLRPEERSAGAGVRAYLEGLAELIALTVLAGLYDRYGWDAAVIFATGFLLVFTLPVLLRRETPVVASGVPGTAKPLRPSVRAFLRRPDSLMVAINLLFAGAALGMFLPMLGAFLVDLKFSIAAVGTIMGAVIFFGMLGGAVVAVTAARFVGARWAATVLAGLIVPLALPMAWLAQHIAPGIPVAIGIITLPTIGVSAFYVLVQAARMEWAIGPQIATDYAIGTAFIKVGLSAGVAAGGILAAKVGWTWFFPIYGSLVAGAIVVFLATSARIPRRIDAATGATG
jgi:PAT family beta-lactamase induction signal transducer AmpG